MESRYRFGGGIAESAYDAAREDIETGYQETLESYNTGPTFQMLQEEYARKTTAVAPARNMNPEYAEVTFTNEQGDVVPMGAPIPTAEDLAEQSAALREELGTFEEYFEQEYGPIEAAERHAQREAGVFEGLSQSRKLDPYRPSRGRGERLRDTVGTGVGVGEEETWMTG